MIRPLYFICLCNLLFTGVAAVACQYETFEEKFSRFFFMPRQVKAHCFFDESTVGYFYRYLPFFHGVCLCSCLDKIKREKERCWVSECEKLDEEIERKSKYLSCYASDSDFELFKPVFFKELESIKKVLFTYWDIIKQKPKKDEKLFLHYFEDPSASADTFFSKELITRYKYEFTKKRSNFSLILLLNDIKDVFAYSWKKNDLNLFKKAEIMHESLRLSAEISSEDSFKSIFCGHPAHLKEALHEKVNADKKNEVLWFERGNDGCFETACRV